jgi:hypothetical protein
VDTTDIHGYNQAESWLDGQVADRPGPPTQGVPRLWVRFYDPRPEWRQERLEPVERYFWEGHYYHDPYSIPVRFPVGTPVQIRYQSNVCLGWFEIRKPQP